jgi:MtaA/CmuA family methyltransferase
MTGRDRVLALVEGRAVDRLPLMPITMMFAADQRGVKYGEYVRNHRSLVDAQCLVAERFDFDHVGCVSDPTREAFDCGATVRFFEDQPPAIVESDALLKDSATLASLKQPDPYCGRMLDRIQAVEMFKSRVGGEKVIEGWIEGPMALACDLRGINTMMLDVIDRPDFCRDLFAFCTELELRFARAQIEAGADLIGIGDAAASLVGPQIYGELIWPFEKSLIDGIHAIGGRVRLHICGNATPLLAMIRELNCEIVDLDYMVPLDEARRILGPSPVLLGNMNPVSDLRDKDASHVRRKLKECHRQAGPRYIVGAGCEVTRDTPLGHVHAMREYAYEQC